MPIPSFSELPRMSDSGQTVHSPQATLWQMANNLKEQLRLLEQLSEELEA